MQENKEKSIEELNEVARAELRLEDGEIIVENSPLAQADPKALDELFSRIDSSLKLNHIPDASDVNKVVFVLRQQRQKFLSMEAAKPIRSPAEKKAISVKAKKIVTSVRQALSVNDL